MSKHLNIYGVSQLPTAYLTLQKKTLSQGRHLHFSSTNYHVSLLYNVPLKQIKWWEMRSTQLNDAGWLTHFLKAESEAYIQDCDADITKAV